MKPYYFIIIYSQNIKKMPESLSQLLIINYSPPPPKKNIIMILKSDKNKTKKKEMYHKIIHSPRSFQGESIEHMCRWIRYARSRWTHRTLWLVPRSPSGSPVSWWLSCTARSTRRLFDKKRRLAVPRAIPS